MPASAGHADRAGHAGNHLDRDARRHAGLEFLHAAAEDERVAALEPDHPAAGARVLDEQRVDLLLCHRPPSRQLRGVDDLDVRRQGGQQGQRREVVGHDDVGLGDRLPPAHGDEPRIAGAAADQHDAAGRAPCGVREARSATLPSVSPATTASRTPTARCGSPPPWTPTTRSPCRPTAGVQALECDRSSARAQKMRARSASSATAAFTAGSSVAATAYQAPSRSPGS